MWKKIKKNKISDIINVFCNKISNLYIIQILRRIFLKGVGFVKSLREKKDKNNQANRTIPWFADNGDKTLRLNYSLNESSIVVDVGGYEGQWASDIFSKYQPTIHIFEPVKKFEEKIRERFIKNKKIIIYKLGLSNKDAEMEISLINDSSSLFKKDETSEKIKIVNASHFLQEKNITTIDLIKINIEGSEYDLLENLIESGFTLNIKNIQVQFHDFVPDAEKRMLKIQEKLALTHHLTYQYPFVWENWEINE